MGGFGKSWKPVTYHYKKTAADSAGKSAGLQPRKGLKRKYRKPPAGGGGIGAESPVSGRNAAGNAPKFSEKLRNGKLLPGSLVPFPKRPKQVIVLH
jgi:hypothetical protein